MEMCNINQRNETNLIENNYEQYNEQFSIRKVQLTNDDDEQMIGYDCIYQLNKNLVKLHYSLFNGIWRILPKQFSIEEEEDQLNNLLNNLHLNSTISFNEQIPMIIQMFNDYFQKLNDDENEKQILIDSIFEEDNENEMKKFNERLNQISINNHLCKTSTTIFEVDEEQSDRPNQLLTKHFQRQIHNLTPMSITQRIRQDSSCSSTNSLKYVQFLPPSTTSICGRRVIQSILLRVQRKKLLLEKAIHRLKNIPSEPTMYQLGLEFLRIYDGKFNYPQGYTFVILFEKRTWFLTIVNIKCVECQLGQSEPRSVLILKYNNQFTTVQV